jgi:hypothetical protein
MAAGRKNYVSTYRLVNDKTKEKKSTFDLWLLDYKATCRGGRATAHIANLDNT